MIDIPIGVTNMLRNVKIRYDSEKLLQKVPHTIILVHKVHKILKSRVKNYIEWVKFYLNSKNMKFYHVIFIFYYLSVLEIISPSEFNPRFRDIHRSES